MSTIKLKVIPLFYNSSLAIIILLIPIVYAENRGLEMNVDKKSYHYSIVKAGDNYNFKFQKKITNEGSRLKIGYQLLKFIYKDESIYKSYSEGYIRERARCYVFDSDFHTYTLCFLPNEFSKIDNDHLKGFVTQMPNWKWLLTRFFLPALLVFSCLYYMTRHKP